MNNKNNCEFFIGYLPMPSNLKRFYWLIAFVMIASAGGLGYGLAVSQHSHHPATWNTAATTEISGYITASPYPTIHRLVGAELLSTLLVNQGKHAAKAAAFDRQWVSVSGFMIQRGDWQMLELNDGEDAINLSVSEANSKATTIARIREKLVIKDLGEIEINGEIVDSKCMLGVMKPGVGVVHKACAEVCLLGGIPPILLAEDARNKRLGFILVNENGNSASRALAKLAAEPVVVRGQLQQHGDFLFVKIAPNGVHRL